MVCPIPRSGKLGFVGDYTSNILTRYRRVRNWTFNPISTPEERRYSGTRYGVQRIPSFTESPGSFNGFGGVPPLFPGDTFTFVGYTTPTSGVPCTVGYAYSVKALVDSVNITWNWTAENKGVNWTVNFSSTESPVEISNFADPCNDAVFCDDNACNLTFVMKDACTNAVIEWCNLVSASLTFTATNNPYSNNSTNCLVKRDIGNLDWTLEVVDQNPNIVPVINKDYWFEILTTVTPATRWTLKFGINLGVSNFTVDTEANTVIGKSNNFSMQAVSCCVPATPVRGSIVNPAGVTVWPYSLPS